MPIDYDPTDRPRRRTTPQPAPLFDTVAPAATPAPPDTRSPEQLLKMAAITNFTTGEPTAKLKRLPIPTNEELARYNRPK